MSRVGLLLLACATAGLASAEEITARLTDNEPRVDARGVLTLVLQITNSSERERQLVGSIELPDGWIVRTPLTALILPAGSTRSFPVVIQAPSHAQAGGSQGRVRLRGEYGESLLTLDFSARLPSRTSLELTLLRAPPVVIDEPPTMELEVRNIGSMRERVQLEADPAATFDVAAFTLEPGASRNVLATLDLPNGLSSSQTRTVTIRAFGDAGGRAELQHSVNLITTSLDEASLWHTVPITARFSTVLTRAGEALSSSARIRVEGGGAWWDGDPTNLTFAIDSDLLGRDPRLLLEYRTPNIGVRLGHAEVGLSPNLARASGFGALADGRLALSERISLSWAAFAQVTPGEAEDEGSQGRFGIRVGTPIGSLGSWSLAGQRNPGLSEARLDARLQVRAPGGFTVGVNLDAALHAPDGLETLFRGGGSLSVRHPVVGGSLTASFTPAGFQAVTRDTRDLSVRADVDLLRLLQLDALRSLRAAVEFRRAQAVVVRETNGVLLQTDGAPDEDEGTLIAELERLRVSVDVATAGSRGEISYTRSDERPAESQLRTVEQSLSLRFTTRVSERWSLTPEANWVSRDVVDTVTGAVAASETVSAGLAGSLQIGAGALTTGLTLTADPVDHRITGVSTTLAWRAPLSDAWQWRADARVSYRPEEASELILAAELSQQTAAGTLGVVIRPLVRFAEERPTLLRLSVSAPQLELMGFITTGSVTLETDTIRGFEWSGQVNTRASFPLGDFGTLDLRGQMGRNENGFSAEIAGRARANLGNDATLTVDTEATFASEQATTARIGVAIEQRFSVRSGYRQGVGSLEGSVLRPDGTPIPHVALRVAGQVVASDANGRFRFPALAVGEHYVQVLPGTVPGDLLLIPSGPLRTTVVAGAVGELHLIALLPATLSGEIRFTLPAGFEHLGNGNGVNGNGVNGNYRTNGTNGGNGTNGSSLLGSGNLRADAARVAGLTLQLQRNGEVRHAISDGNGHFRFANLEPGSWNLRIDGSRLPTTLRLGEYPRTLNLADGAALELVIELEPVVRRVTLEEGGTVGTP